MAKSQSELRKERLAAALRANLKRRKQKNRALVDAEQPDAANSPPVRLKSGTKTQQF